MDVVSFITKVPTMAHPDQLTIIKLRIDNRLHKNVVLLLVHVFGFGNTC